MPLPPAAVLAHFNGYRPMMWVLQLEPRIATCDPPQGHIAGNKAQNTPPAATGGWNGNLESIGPLSPSFEGAGALSSLSKLLSTSGKREIMCWCGLSWV